MGALIFQAAQPSDREVLSRLVAAEPLLQGYGMTPERAAATVERMLSDPHSSVICCQSAEGGLLGLAWVDLRGGFGVSAYLRLLVVAPDAQGKGVGEGLIVEMESRHLGKYGLFALCNSLNERALRFYEKLGYQRLGQLPGFVHPDKDEVILYRAPKTAAAALKG